MKQCIPKPVQQGKEHNWEILTMAFYNEKEQLYPEADMSGVGLGASLLQVRGGMQFPRNGAPNNATVQSAASKVKPDKCRDPL